jgi:hypothetical protein
MREWQLGHTQREMESRYWGLGTSLQEMWSVERWEVREAKEAQLVKVDETFRGHDWKGQRKRPWGLCVHLPVWQSRSSKLVRSIQVQRQQPERE